MTYLLTVFRREMSRGKIPDFEEFDYAAGNGAAGYAGYADHGPAFVGEEAPASKGLGSLRGGCFVGTETQPPHLYQVLLQRQVVYGVKLSYAVKTVPVMYTA